MREHLSIRRQLIVMVGATTSLVLIALLVPMMSLISRFAVEDALARTGLEVQATESVVALRERADLVAFVADLNAEADGTRTTVLFPDGDAIGPDKETTPDVVEARRTGRAISNTTAAGVEVLVPVNLNGAEVDDQVPAPRPPEESVAVIREVIEESRLLPDVVLAWVIMGVLGLGLLGLAILVASRLARSLLQSVTELAETAEQLEQGRLEARASPSGPAEIVEVGHGLNRLADRITELLAAERTAAADLSHRLRTPLMALRLEADELADPDERERMQAALHELTRYVDAVITEARRPVREGLGASTDATAVVRERTTFWAVLAEDQDRPTTIRLPRDPLPVKVTAGDLEAVVDVLLENVFAHTDEGTGFTVALAPRPDGGAVLRVQDFAPSGPDADPPEPSAPGSTGLGLDIVRRTAAASGGSANVDRSQRGTTVEVSFGAPAE